MARRTAWGQFDDERVAIIGRYAIDVTSPFLTARGMTGAQGLTILAVKAELAIRPLVPSNLGLEAYSAGLLVDTTQAVAGGVAAIPDPASSDAGWLWYYKGSLDLTGYESSAGFFGAATRFIEVDARSKRRLGGISNRLVFLFTNEGTQSFTVHMKGRVLYLLP